MLIHPFKLFLNQFSSVQPDVLSLVFMRIIVGLTLFVPTLKKHCQTRRIYGLFTPLVISSSRLIFVLKPLACYLKENKNT
jgi:hypothetical protein